jgi:phage gp29-like protein
MKKSQSTKTLALAKRNASISEGMKKYHEDRRKAIEESLLVQKSLAGRFASISQTRDAYKTTYVNLTVAQIRSILDSVKSGYLNQWSDFADYMIDTDPHVQGLVNIRTHAISGRKILIQPNGDSEQAKLAASFARQCIDNIPSFDKFLRQLLIAEFKGASLAEIIYKRNDELKCFDVKEISPIPLRKIKIKLNQVDENGDMVNTPTTTGYGRYQYEYWNYGDVNSADAVNVFDLYPGKFIIHSPGDQEMQHYRGILRAAAFVWFFKQAALAFYVSASEKYASPVTYAKVPAETEQNTRLQLVENLNNLANDAAAVFDSDVIIDTINVANSGGAAIWQQLIGMLNAELSKLILGGTLSVEASSTGANRALGEVMERTRIDLQIADANALSETLRHQLIKPLLEYNLHLFGGKAPPLPLVSFDIVTRDYEAISQMHLDAGIITNNELRDSVGLPPWTTEEGGDEKVKLGSNSLDPMAAAMGMPMSITNGAALEPASTKYINSSIPATPSEEDF